nr:hypothetical protein [Tanacetum cinerariifolium]
MKGFAPRLMDQEMNERLEDPTQGEKSQWDAFAERNRDVAATKDPYRVGQSRSSRLMRIRAPASKKERRVSLALRVIPGPSSGVKATGLRGDMVSRIPARCHTKGAHYCPSIRIARPDIHTDTHYCPSVRREDQTVDVTALPKFDMPSYKSKMTAKNVKSLALHHGIPLDLHLVALTEGWTMDKLPDDMIVGKGAGGQVFQETFSGLKGWKQRVFFLDRRAISDAMVWRHHDSDINDPILKDGFSMQDMEAITERVIDLRPVPSGLLFQGGLATTWDYSGFRPIFKDTEGNVVTMSEYLRFWHTGSREGFTFNAFSIFRCGTPAMTDGSHAKTPTLSFNKHLS